MWLPSSDFNHICPSDIDARDKKPRKYQLLLLLCVSSAVSSFNGAAPTGLLLMLQTLVGASTLRIQLIFLLLKLCGCFCCCDYCCCYCCCCCCCGYYCCCHCAIAVSAAATTVASDFAAVVAVVGVDYQNVITWIPRAVV